MTETVNDVEAQRVSERILYPVIGLLGGRVVRALRDVEAPEADDDPVALARGWREAGARWLSLVDLDGARDGAPRQLDVIRSIIADVGLPAQVAGGLRETASVEAALAAGASRVVLNAATPDEQALVAECVARWGEQIAVALEARDGRVTVAGWLPSDAATALDVARGMRYLGVTTLIVTSSASAEPNPLPSELRRALPGIRLIAGGASASLDALRECLAQGFDGALLGQALYDGRYTFTEAQAVADAAPAYEPPAPERDGAQPPSAEPSTPVEPSVTVEDGVADGESDVASVMSDESGSDRDTSQPSAHATLVEPDDGVSTPAPDSTPAEPIRAANASALPGEPDATADATDE